MRTVWYKGFDATTHTSNARSQRPDELGSLWLPGEQHGHGEREEMLMDREMMLCSTLHSQSWSYYASPFGVHVGETLSSKNTGPEVYLGRLTLARSDNICLTIQARRESVRFGEADRPFLLSTDRLKYLWGARGSGKRYIKSCGRLNGLATIVYDDWLHHAQKNQIKGIKNL